MSARSLIILLTVLVLLVGLAVLQSQRSAVRPAQGGLSPGDALLPGFDANAVAAMEIAVAGTTVTVSRADGRWVVDSLYKHPADYRRVADALLGIQEMKVGQVVYDGEENPGAYGLGPTDAVLRVRALDAAGKELADLALGAVKAPSAQGGFGAYALARYVRAGDGSVVLVDGSHDLGGHGEDWIVQDLLNVPAQEVERVTVEASGAACVLLVKGGPAYEMDGLKSGEEIDTGNAARLAGAFQYLRCSGVADPALADADLGLTEPAKCIVATREGFEYAALIGGTAPNPAQRYIRLSASYRRPPAPTEEQAAAAIPENVTAQEARLAEMNAKFEGWTYLVSGHMADAMTLGRDKLVRKKQAQPEEKKADKNEAAE